jgi:hypothetical protein
MGKLRNDGVSILGTERLTVALLGSHQLGLRDASHADRLARGGGVKSQSEKTFRQNEAP